MMPESRLLIDTLKRCLRASNLTYRDVAERLSLSEATVKRILATGRMDIGRLEALCGLVDLNISELCRLAERVQGERDLRLSVKQERALAEDPQLLRYFYRLLNGWSTARVNHDLGLSATSATRILAHLDRLALIEYLPEERIRLRVGPQVEWRRDGPLWQRYAAEVQSDFLGSGFQQQGEVLAFESGELSRGSLEVLGRKLAQLAREFRQLVEVDASLAPEDRQHAGFLLGLKPWQFSALFEPGRNEQPGTDAADQRM